MNRSIIDHGLLLLTGRSCRLKKCPFVHSRILHPSHRVFRSGGHCYDDSGHVGPAAKNAQGIERMLATPSWSVSSLFKSEGSESPSENSITRKQLHHLLRLSALPLPETEAEEAGMLKDLESQLRLVRAIQEVDTEGVEPLVSIRDETVEGQKEDEITLESLWSELEKEEVVGTRGHIRRKAGVMAEKEDAEDWDPLACAPRTKGRFIALETKKS